MDIQPVLDFLPCRTPAAWLAHAMQHVDALLLDHASLELKAAQQAQTIIRKYGAVGGTGSNGLSDAYRHRLLNRMSRLAREELRHFEQVLALIESRGRAYRAISASRYASVLHARARRNEPGALIDTLVIGAIIEARSCERFYSLLTTFEKSEPDIAKFYGSLLRSEARHFGDYLTLARDAAKGDISGRIEELLGIDAELITSSDTELRFHSGRPAAL